jgi:tetratricopeptide (TPR) repeat protein
MIILHDQPESEITKSLFPNPLLDLYERRSDDFEVFEVLPWTEQETAAYLSSRSLEADAQRLTKIGLGLPGFIAEVIELLQERDELSQLDNFEQMSDIVPLQVDQDEIDLPEEPTEEGERHRATAEDAPRIAHLAALLGQAFPANLVADMSGYDRDSIDDLFDALGGLVQEVQFSEPLSTWIYRFRHEAYRKGILQQNDNDEGHEMARRIGAFMERNLVPRGYNFITKTARVYAEHGAIERASALRSVALNNDNPDVWSLSYDFMRYFDELKWTDSLRNTLYINLLDRLIGAGKIQAAEKIHQEACEWATEKDDRNLTGWLLFAGSRLDTRKRDYYRARDRAADAIKIYKALDLPIRAGEVYNHLANIELLDGKPEEALKQVNEAVTCGQVKGEDGKTYVVAPIIAHAEQVRGLVARRNKDLKKAIEHFKKANEHAGQAGIAALALDSGLSLGEALLAAKNFENAREVLRQVTKIAMSLRNTVRERRSCELLAQAEGALKNFDAAIRLASRTLELSSQLRFEKSIAIDHYHLGVFQYRANQHSDALENLNRAHEQIGGLGEHPVLKDIVFFKGLCLLQTGDLEAAQETLTEGYKLAQEARDWHKSIGSLDSLAQIAKKQGDTGTARKHLTDALAIARKASLKNVRAEIRRKLEAL